jgi:two-component system, OmpR family, sensor histidine kinase SenX3
VAQHIGELGDDLVMLKNITAFKVLIPFFDRSFEGFLLCGEEPVQSLPGELGLGLAQSTCKFGKPDLIFGSKFNHHPISVGRHTCRVKRLPQLYFPQPMNINRRRGAIAFFITLGVCLTILAITLNITWITNNSSRLAMDFLGVVLFSILIAGVVTNTIFLVREIRRNERQDSFLNAVTHELKTPIASLRLYLETLQRRPVDEAQRQKFYAIMHSDTDRLLGTVETVLKAGELAQRSDRKRTRIELHPLVADCVAIVCQRHHLAPDAIELADVPGAVRLFVSGNLEDLRIAILNLLDNAVKYSPNGVHIRCRLGIEHYTWALLSITDTGLGLPSRELKRIFKRFYRVSSNDLVKIKGTGLGLFLVRTIARQHGGDVRATSAGPGKGTTMSLRLPLLIGGPNA